jgi:hypothetical protein
MRAFVFLFIVCTSPTLIWAANNKSSSSSSGDDEARKREDERRADEDRAREIRNRASDIRNRASNVRNEAGRVRSASQNLRSETSRMDSERSSAQMKLNGISSEISGLKNQTENLGREAQSLRSQAASYRNQQAGVEREIEANKPILVELMKVVYNLRARVKFKEEELAALDAFQKQVDAILINLNTLGSLQTKAAVSFATAIKQHDNWMNRLSVVSASMAPHFKELKSSNDIRVAKYKIQAFPKQAPDPAAPNNSEVTAAEDQHQIAILTDATQKMLRNIGEMRGFAVMNSYSPDKIDSLYWQQIDVSIHKNIELYLQLDTLFKLFQERRIYLVNIIPLLWERMLNVRLDSLNLQKSVQSGLTGIEGLSVPQLASRATELDNAYKDTLQLIYKAQMAAALEKIDGALTLANQLLEQLAKMKTDAASQVQSQILQKQSRLLALKERVGKGGAR